MSRAGTQRIPKRISVPVLAALALALLVPSAASAANSLAVHGSVNQVYVTGATPGTSLRLVRKGKTVSKSPSAARRRPLPPGRGREGLPGPRRRRHPLGPGRRDEGPLPPKTPRSTAKPFPPVATAT